eukprot:4685257-Pleurochrysis_carterae.AAC.4
MSMRFFRTTSSQFCSIHSSMPAETARANPKGARQIRFESIRSPSLSARLLTPPASPPSDSPPGPRARARLRTTNRSRPRPHFGVAERYARRELPQSGQPPRSQVVKSARTESREEAMQAGQSYGSSCPGLPPVSPRLRQYALCFPRLAHAKCLAAGNLEANSLVKPLSATSAHRISA